MPNTNITPQTGSLQIQSTEAQIRDSLREWKAKMQAGYAELGEFIVEFSQLEFTIRAALGGTLKLPPELSNPLLSLYDFTALCNAWKLVMTHQQPVREKDFEAIRKRCLDINTQRVRVAHGLWTFNAQSFEATHIARNSLKVDTYFAEPGELKDLSSQCQQILHAVLVLAGASLVLT